MLNYKTPKRVCQYNLILHFKNNIDLRRYKKQNGRRKAIQYIHCQKRVIIIFGVIQINKISYYTQPSITFAGVPVGRDVQFCTLN